MPQLLAHPILGSLWIPQWGKQASLHESVQIQRGQLWSMLWGWVWESVLRKTIPLPPHYTVKLPGLNISEPAPAVNKSYVLKDYFFFHSEKYEKSNLKLPLFLCIAIWKHLWPNSPWLDLKAAWAVRSCFISSSVSVGVCGSETLCCAVCLSLGISGAPTVSRWRLPWVLRGLTQPSQVYTPKDPAKGLGDTLFNFQLLVQSKKGSKKSLVCIIGEGMPALAALSDLHLLSKLARWTFLSSVCLLQRKHNPGLGGITSC